MVTPDSLGESGDHVEFPADFGWRAVALYTLAASKPGEPISEGVWSAAFQIEAHEALPAGEPVDPVGPLVPVVAPVPAVEFSVSAKSGPLNDLPRSAVHVEGPVRAQIIGTSAGLVSIRILEPGALLQLQLEMLHEGIGRLIGQPVARQLWRRRERTHRMVLENRLLQEGEGDY